MKSREISILFVLICFLSTIMLMNISDASSSKTFYVIASKVNLRKKPEIKSEIVGKVFIATQVKVEDSKFVSNAGTVKQVESWVYVLVNDGKNKGIRGWMAQQYLVNTKPTMKYLINIHDIITELHTKQRIVWAERAMALNPKDPRALKRYKAIDWSNSKEAIHKLTVAVKNNDLATVKKLISTGTNINTDITGPPGLEQNSGITPLHGALFKGHIEMSIYLIKNGADLNRQTSIGMGEDRHTPLSLAIYRGYKTVVPWLIKKGANITHCATTAGQENGTPLIIAIEKEYYDIAKMLVKKGANINAMGCQYGGYGTTALCAATKSYEMTEFLIKHKADVNIKGPDKKTTPLKCARHNNNVDVIKLLIKSGGAPEVRKSPLVLRKKDKLWSYYKGSIVISGILSITNNQFQGGLLCMSTRKEDAYLIPRHSENENAYLFPRQSDEINPKFCLNNQDFSMKHLGINNDTCFSAFGTIIINKYQQFKDISRGTNWANFIKGKLRNKDKIKWTPCPEGD